MDNGRHTKKTWIPTAVSSTNRGSRIAQKNRTDNAKPTPNIKYTLVLLTTIKWSAYARAYTTRTTNLNKHKRDNLYPVGHLSLLSPDSFFEICEISICQNRAQ